MCVKPDEKPSGRCGTPPLELLVRDVLETPKTGQALAIALGGPPELDSKTLLLETPHTLVIRHGEVYLTTRKLPPS